jgi:hypothetical protein
MISKCRLCGCTEADSIADAKTLGLEEELQKGVYTCCQIAAWAHEQWLAWFEATNEDARPDLPDERSQKNDLIQFVAVASLSRDNFVSLCCAFDLCGMAFLSHKTSQTQEAGRHMYRGDFVAQRSRERLHRRIQASFGG